MSSRVIFAAAVFVLGGCGAQARSERDAFSKTGELIALSGGDAGASAACHVCHGLDGGGNGAGAPRLAGLPQGYLVKQLQDYAHGLRPDDVMGPIARQLTPEERQLVSAWYAARPAPEISITAPAPSPMGERLWLGGDASRSLAACASCHGVHGEGAGGRGPPLHDQPPLYLAEQLHRWRRGERQNDPGSIMIEISRSLRAAEIEAVAVHAAGLPGPSAPAAPETEPSPP